MSCNEILPPAGGEYRTYRTSASYVRLTVRPSMVRPCFASPVFGELHATTRLLAR